MHKKYRYLLILLLTFFSGAIIFTGTRFLGVVDAEPYSYSYSFGHSEKINLYPGEVKTDAWSNANEALVQKVDEDATYQNFSARTAAYLPIPTIVIDGVPLDIQSGSTESLPENTEVKPTVDDSIKDELSPVVEDNSSTVNEPESDASDSNLPVDETSDDGT